MSKTLRIVWLVTVVAISVGLLGNRDHARAGDDAESKRASLSNGREPSTDRPPVAPNSVAAGRSAQGYGINKLVIGSGGGGALPQSNTGMLLTVNQTAAGRSTGQSYGMELGFWYAVSACPIVVTGDVQQSGDVNLTDVVYLVNYVLKAGPEPYPCAAAGDVNCSGGVNSTDIIYVVNYVLKAGPAPCNACSLVPWTWSCP